MTKKQKHEGLKEYSEKVILRKGGIRLENPALEVTIDEEDGVVVSREGEVLNGITDIIIKITAKERSVTVKGVSREAFLSKAGGGE